MKIVVVGGNGFIGSKPVTMLLGMAMTSWQHHVALESTSSAVIVWPKP